MLGPLGFNIYRALTVDLLHEFELGIFKSVFRHLLWLLHAINPMSGTNLVATIDARYVLCTVHLLNQTAQYGFWDRFCQIPPFGKGSIRQFPFNVTEACQCAARHFEDLLQVGYVGDWYALFGLTFGPVCYACIRGFISSRT